MSGKGVSTTLFGIVVYDGGGDDEDGGGEVLVCLWRRYAENGKRWA